MNDPGSAEMTLDQLTAETARALDHATASAAAEISQPWSGPLVMYLSSAILVFGIVVMGIMGWLVVRRGITQGVLRLICVPLIVVAAVFLVVVGYNRDQLTPLIGLLGTIAGYLLGKTDPPIPPATRIAPTAQAVPARPSASSGEGDAPGKAGIEAVSRDDVPSPIS